MLNKITGITLLILCILLSSCDRSRVYDEYKTLPDKAWNKFYRVKFEVPIKDTIALHNLYINIRNTGKYSFSNFYLFIKVTSPDGRSIKDTFEIILADTKGNWLGHGLGDLKDQQTLYKKDIRFTKSGTYIFELEQAMRVDDLSGIRDIGLRIEKSEVKH
jgi:gliding motility-associated lipoprotein GldH